MQIQLKKPEFRTNMYFRMPFFYRSYKMLVADISPSMLSSDFANLATEAKRMTQCGAHSLHLDVMDGHFVPNLTLGAPIVKALRKHTTAFLDCHLMVSDPGKWVDDFSKAGADRFTFHIETQAEMNPTDLITKIRLNSKMLIGIAIKPKTPVESVIPYAHLIDLVLVMTVEPGFGGQKIMLDCLEKVKILRNKFRNLNIQVDGGIDVSNIDQCAASGANVIVSGVILLSHHY